MRRLLSVLCLIAMLLTLLMPFGAWAEEGDISVAVSFSTKNPVHNQAYTASYAITGGSGQYTGIRCVAETYATGLVIASQEFELTEASGVLSLRQKTGEQVKLRFFVTDSEGRNTEFLSSAVTLGRTFFEWVSFILDKYGTLFINGVLNTLLISIIGTIAGFLIGLIVAVLRTIPMPEAHQKLSLLRKILLKLLNFLLSVYIEVFRGTPMMVQAMVIYYGLAGLGLRVPVLTAALVIVSVNTGAYMAEIIRGGIISVDKGQKEAAHAIGMTHTQAMARVILPQAVRNIMPSIGNEFVVNIKDSSVLNVISVSELFFVSKSAAGTYLRYFEVFFITACIYLVLTFTVTRLLRILERKMDGKANYTICGSQSDSQSTISLKKEEIPHD